MGETRRGAGESDTKQVEKQLEFDETTHGDDPVDSLFLPDGTTEAEALQMAIDRAEDEGRKIRRVVHPGDARAGPVADRPLVNMG